MKKGIAVLSVAALLFCATGARAAGSDVITFTIDIGASCVISGGTTNTVTFLDTGTGTATQTGSLGLECTVGTTPVVTVTGGDGPLPGSYDFSGRMINGANEIPFTGSWTATPIGAGMGTTISWDFSVTATGLSGAAAGIYSKSLTFTVNP